MFRHATVIAMLLLLDATLATAQDDIVIADFEKTTYGQWQVEGEAFGKGPAKRDVAGSNERHGLQGRRPGQQLPRR